MRSVILRALTFALLVVASSAFTGCGQYVSRKRDVNAKFEEQRRLVLKPYYAISWSYELKSASKTWKSSKGFSGRESVSIKDGGVDLGTFAIKTSGGVTLTMMNKAEHMARIGEASGAVSSAGKVTVKGPNALELQAVIPGSSSRSHTIGADGLLGVPLTGEGNQISLKKTCEGFVGKEFMVNVPVTIEGVTTELLLTFAVKSYKIEPFRYTPIK